ncbi:MAG: RDD family protein [Cyanobacteriota bacterium]
MRFFNRITLQTPESVELEFTLAGIGNRAYALLIDYLVWATLLIFFFIFWAIFSWQLLNILGNWVRSNGQIELWLIAIQILVTFFIYVGYFVIFEALWQGQTPGKRYVKIRVIRDDGRPVGLQQSTLRALLRPFDDFLFLGTFLIVFGKQEKRLGDWVAGTVVIQEERPVASASIPVSQEAQSLASQLLIDADISQMLPEDFAVVREYLQRRAAMIPEARSELSRQLAKQFKEVITLESVPKGTSANLFLEAVYLAYQQQSSTR